MFRTQKRVAERAQRTGRQVQAEVVVQANEAARLSADTLEKETEVVNLVVRIPNNGTLDKLSVLADPNVRCLAEQYGHLQRGAGDPERMNLNLEAEHKPRETTKAAAAADADAGDRQDTSMDMADMSEASDDADWKDTTRTAEEEQAKQVEQVKQVKQAPTDLAILEQTIFDTGCNDVSLSEVAPPDFMPFDRLALKEQVTDEQEVAQEAETQAGEDAKKKAEEELRAKLAAMEEQLAKSEAEKQADRAAFQERWEKEQKQFQEEIQKAKEESGALDPAQAAKVYEEFRGKMMKDFERKQINDEAVLEALRARNEFLEQFTQLMLHRSKVTDDVMPNLARLCLRLTELRLQETKVSDVGIQPFLMHCKKLLILNVNKCKVTDATLIELPKLCPGLIDLNIGNTEITDAGVSKLAAGCKNLQRLALLGCKQITDAAVESVSQCRHLELLNLNSTKVTDKGLKFLVDSTKLKELFLVNCQVTDSGIRELLRACPNIVSLPCSLVPLFEIVEITKTEDRTLGMSVGVSGSFLVITSVADHGPIFAWNENHWPRVQAGNLIIEVNGVKDSGNKLRDECMNQQVLRMVVVRDTAASFKEKLRDKGNFERMKEDFERLKEEFPNVFFEIKR